MKIIEKMKVDSVTDVVCDVCFCSTQVIDGGLEFATLQANWGYATKHDGMRYELHLCESCFFWRTCTHKAGAAHTDFI